MEVAAFPICGKEICNCSYERHLLSQEKNPNYHTKKQTSQSEIIAG